MTDEVIMTNTTNDVMMTMLVITTNKKFCGLKLVN